MERKGQPPPTHGVVKRGVEPHELQQVLQDLLWCPSHHQVPEAHQGPGAQNGFGIPIATILPKFPQKKAQGKASSVPAAGGMGTGSCCCHLLLRVVAGWLLPPCRFFCSTSTTFPCSFRRMVLASTS